MASVEPGTAPAVERREGMKYKAIRVLVYESDSESALKQQLEHSIHGSKTWGLREQEKRITAYDVEGTMFERIVDRLAEADRVIKEALSDLLEPAVAE